MRVPLATFWWNISISAMNIHLYFVPSTYPKYVYLCARANFKRRKSQQTEAFSYSPYTHYQNIRIYSVSNCMRKLPFLSTFILYLEWFILHVPNHDDPLYSNKYCAEGQEEVQVSGSIWLCHLSVATGAEAALTCLTHVHLGNPFCWNNPCLSATTLRKRKTSTITSPPYYILLLISSIVSEWELL